MAIDKTVYDAVKSGRSDNNIKFSDFQKLLTDLGFEFQRQEGSHRIYHHPGIMENMNIQPVRNMAKGYQVRQLRGFIKDYNL